jgi:hypothetical protein
MNFDDIKKLNNLGNPEDIVVHGNICEQISGKKVNGRCLSFNLSDAFCTCFSITAISVSIGPISFDIIFRVIFPLITFCDFVAALSGFDAMFLFLMV